MNLLKSSTQLQYSMFHLAVIFYISSSCFFVNAGILEAGQSDDLTYLRFNDSELHFDGKKTKLMIKLPPVNRTYLIDKEHDSNFNMKASKCRVPEWNTIRTSEIPEIDLHKQWVQRENGKNSYLYGETAGMFSAFLHKNQIVVTMTTENLYGKTMYCRYFDCNKNEIIDQYESVVFPESTVFCPRRPGAEYISLTRTLSERVEYSVPIISRIEGPKHYFTVCMAPLYGEEPKFLQIAEFIEYYKLQGATFFHIYVRNVTDYDRVLLDDYVRTGEAEVIKMHDHYWRDDWMWHNPEINDCHQRTKYFSKWTAFIDLDEHIEMKSEKFKTISSLLDDITDPNVNNLHFKVQWVIKDKDLPARYLNDEQILNEMVFRNYRNTSIIANYWTQPKCIIRPDRFAGMSIHAPRLQYKGLVRTLVSEEIGVVRHYRNVQIRVFPEALKQMMSLAPFSITDVAEWIKEKLTKAILERVKWIYDITEVPCEMQNHVHKIYSIPLKNC